ncbi:hypothetical protein [Pseudomonas abietaniphila]|uniref:hypothetical protein n=1 Tax=Pseudomonas abietaniphila TaxID=89065 RepID=UPI0007813860|nr:hypothetical protein [Pseudomonas abietaniphila]
MGKHTLTHLIPSGRPKCSTTDVHSMKDEGNSNLKISPINEYRSTWMTVYGGIRELRIVDGIIPGTHDSGMDKAANYSLYWESTQDESPYDQLMAGIRVLDLRVHFQHGLPVGHHRRFSLFHASDSGRSVQGDILLGINYFRNHKPAAGDPKKEIIILDFHEFKDFTDAAHRELIDIIKRDLGDLIIPPDKRDTVIKDLWAGPGRVVIAYNSARRDPTFWPGVNQRWSGKDYISTGDLKDFIDGVSREVKPWSELRSIQCHKITLFGTPDDFQDRIGEWFYSNDIIGSGAFIQKFSIINTDWASRGWYIDYCIHASFIKSHTYRDEHYILVNQSESFKLPNLFTHLRVELKDGYWTRELILPDPRPSTESFDVYIKTSAAYNVKIKMNGAAPGTADFTLTTNGSATIAFDSQTQQWTVITGRNAVNEEKKD